MKTAIGLVLNQSRVVVSAFASFATITALSGQPILIGYSSLTRMDSFKDTLAFWTTILGTIVALFGVIQSVSWFAGIGAVLITGSIFSIGYGKKQRQLLNQAGHRVEGRSIDSLNLASLRRHLNRTLIIQDAQNTATIRGEDLTVFWDCTGYCKVEGGSAIEFSIDTDNNIPFNELRCFAYDLQNDPGRKHRIRPLLMGPDGMSKKIAIPFLAPLAAQEPFRIELTCELPGCMKAGLEYYTASLSFDQDRLHQYGVRILFEGDRPEWLRVYEFAPSGAPKLLRDVAPMSVDEARTVYRDLAEDLPAQSARVYFFRRDHVMPL